MKTKRSGGIQVIGVGDFLQLPPVKNTRCKDLGEYAFESELFLPTSCVFKRNFQTDKSEFDCVNNLSKGLLNEESEVFVREWQGLSTLPVENH